jgi:hypothetical protein
MSGPIDGRCLLVVIGPETGNEHVSAVGPFKTWEALIDAESKLNSLIERYGSDAQVEPVFIEPMRDGEWPWRVLRAADPGAMDRSREAARQRREAKLEARKQGTTS